MENGKYRILNFPFSISLCVSVELNFVFLNSAQSNFAERIYKKIKIRKAFVSRKTFVETKVNLLRDDGDFESSENVIKKYFGQIAPGSRRIHFG